ncbi:hypothetical protein NC653_041227 [Populus alba x Populus x berolinensis]|uniref:Uncharacterized protein n=1 Tax=Populus alba x Populus x berolinensis TaxID=444605 RepID=A0AAD6LAE3_9ROSI|nr:hypothetical protein NC653_041227 [Populus alba x Populus x berolinensis]
MSNITHHQRISFKTQAIKSFYSNFIESFTFINDHSCPNELGNINCNFFKDWDSSVGAIDELHPHPIGGAKLKFLESYNISDVEEGPLNSEDHFADNTDSLIRLVEPEITSTIDMTTENPSLGSDSLEMDNDSLSSAKAGFDDFLVEESIAKRASFVVYFYGPAKDFLPPEIRSALNLSEERVTEILRLIGATFQQVYIAIEGLEKSLGLDPNDPIMPFVFFFIGTSSTLWGFYRVWVYGVYSGDLSPQLTLRLLPGKEDVRPEVLRERDGIPDLRRATRFRCAIITLPEVDGPVRKLLKGGRYLDDILTAVVIQNLKAL